MVKLLGPQQTAWQPRSSCRAAPRSLMNTSFEAVTIGPTPGCGHAGHPCASASTCALSPRRAAAGIVEILRSLILPRARTSVQGGGGQALGRPLLARADSAC